MALVADGIAPDYLLKPDAQNSVSEDFPRLPNWDYSAEGWERPNDNPIGGTAFFLLNKDFVFDPTNYTLTYFNNIGHSYTTRYYTPANYQYEWDAYVTATAPPIISAPDGSIFFPWEDAGLITTSASYNYQYVWGGGFDGAVISVAPLVSTTGWAHPIPPPTQVPSPNNYYNRASATSLQSLTSTYSTTVIDFAVQLPNNTAEIDISIVPGTAGLSVRVGNCDGLNSGNAIYFVADKPIPQNAIQFYGNNTYILPTFHSNGEFFVTCNHVTSGADQFIIVIDYPNIDWLSIFRSPGIVGV